MVYGWLCSLSDFLQPLNVTEFKQRAKKEVLVLQNKEKLIVYLIYQCKKDCKINGCTSVRYSRGKVKPTININNPHKVDKVNYASVVVNF